MAPRETPPPDAVVTVPSDAEMNARAVEIVRAARHLLQRHMTMENVDKIMASAVNQAIMGDWRSRDFVALFSGWRAPPPAVAIQINHHGPSAPAIPDEETRIAALRARALDMAEASDDPMMIVRVLAELRELPTGAGDQADRAVILRTKSGDITLRPGVRVDVPQRTVTIPPPPTDPETDNGSH